MQRDLYLYPGWIKVYVIGFLIGGHLIKAETGDIKK